jgi:hypothetical protein
MVVSRGGSAPIGTASVASLASPAASPAASSLEASVEASAPLNPPSGGQMLPPRYWMEQLQARCWHVHFHASMLQ